MTTTRASFQSNILARVAIVTRVALSVRRGACLDINQYAVTWGTTDLRQAIARASEDDPGARTLSPACRRLRNPPTGRLLTLDKERKLLLRERHRLRANAMASRTIDRIFENSRTSKPLLVSKTPVACRVDRHEAAEHGSSKPRNQRWIDFLRSTAGAVLRRRGLSVSPRLVLPHLQYEVDAWHPKWRAGLEVEAGRAWMGNAIYRDLIQALVMVDMEHLFLAVPKAYLCSAINRSGVDCTF